MELRDYLAALRKRWLTVGLVSAAAVAAALVAIFATTPTYRATTQLFFAVQGGESVTDLAQGSSFTERQMTSYARVATSPLVLGPASDRLGTDTTVEELADSVSANVPANTVILEITATSDDAAFSARIANAVSTQLSETVGELFPERPDGSRAVQATLLNRAEEPTRPASPNVRLYLALGILGGLALGVSLAVLRERTDTRIRSESDLLLVTDRPVLGAITFDSKAPKSPLVMEDDPTGQRAESIRRVRTNLQYVDVDHGLTSISVTSSVPNEGKSTTAANLALTLADAGTRVILVDADFRRPSVADVMGIEGSVGLTTVLIGQADLNEAIQPWREGSLDILAAGRVPPNPSELLSSEGMAMILERLKEEYDLVLLDSPPLLPVTDAAIIARLVSGSIVVADSRQIHRGQVQAALGTLDAVGAHVLGLVLNKVAPREGHYGYGYGAEEPGSREGTGSLRRRIKRERGAGRPVARTRR